MPKSPDTGKLSQICDRPADSVAIRGSIWQINSLIQHEIKNNYKEGKWKALLVRLTALSGARR